MSTTNVNVVQQQMQQLAVNAVPIARPLQPTLPCTCHPIKMRIDAETMCCTVCRYHLDAHPHRVAERRREHALAQAQHLPC